MTCERDAFIKSLKSNAAAYIDKPDRASIGGYDVLSKASIPAYINQLTGLTAHNGAASSIEFTRDDDRVLLSFGEHFLLIDNQYFQNVYHRLPLLISIAQRLLRPVDSSRKDSVLSLFAGDYTEIPDQLISVVCAMVCTVADNFVFEF